MNEKKDYLRRMHDLREDADLSQQELGEMLQIRQQQYSLYESGERSLPIDLMIALVEYYDVSADYFLGFTDVKKNDNVKRKKKG